MTEEELISQIGAMVDDCESYRDELSASRTKAIEYYDGTRPGIPKGEENMSRVVSRDVRAAVKKILPSVIRTILGNDEVVEYSPLGQGDEEKAAQATDYVNYIILPESGGYQAIHDAVHDALRLRNGAIKWWWEKKAYNRVSSNTGLDDDAFAELVSDPSVVVLEHTERVEQVGDAEVRTHDLKIRREEVREKARVACLPMDEFLIHPDALTVEDSPIVGHKCKMTRSDLVAMGYDREQVKMLPVNAKEDEEEAARRPDAYEMGETDGDEALQEVDYYELYVRTDMDGDGIAELRRMCFGGAITTKGLLADDECDEVQMCTIAAERKPHQWEGVSIADDVMEIQDVKTALFRQTLNNLYWQNMPQPIYQDGMVDLDSVVNPAFGKPIKVKQGKAVAEALDYNRVPFMAKESFAMLEYLDNEMTDRTGISDASSGMAPDALQNMTAKASAMIEAAGIGQTEMIVRNIANDLKALFRGLLRLIIKHQDKPRTVRLRDEWVDYDPRQWNAGMDATVNTGLGAGTRERDMMMMQVVLATQEKILAGLGPDNPFVKPDNLYNAFAKMIEAAGLKSPDMYITEPNPQEVEARLKALREKPDPETQKLQAQMQLEQQKMAANRDKEMAQMQADIEVKKVDLGIERERLAQEKELKLMELQQQREIELAKLGMTEGSAGIVHRENALLDTSQRLADAMQAMASATALLQQIHAAQTAPKRVLRDPETNDVIGVEPILEPQTVN